MTTGDHLKTSAALFLSALSLASPHPASAAQKRHAATAAWGWGPAAAGDRIHQQLPERRSQEPSSQPLRRPWLDTDGQPLPFRTEEALLEFLGSAEIVSTKNVSGGITNIKRVLLKKNGLNINAAFRDVDERRTVKEFGNGTRQPFFRDQAVFECAAYTLDRLLGLGRVPPVVERKIGKQQGSLQFWLEGTITEGTRKREGRAPPDQQRWNKQIRMMTIFDRLIANSDRNLGNMLIDQGWRIWLIDHTRAFRPTSSIGNMEGITRIERGLWSGLQGLDDDAIKEELGRFLTKREMHSLLKRKQKLIDHFQKLIDQRGEDAVLYSLPEETSISQRH
ncbi:MAG: hypothetical protein ACE5HV_10525 [Acidobacteriota bacterium]